MKLGLNKVKINIYIKLSKNLTIKKDAFNQTSFLTEILKYIPTK